MNDHTSQASHAVIYTDGGCRPSRGIGGWGFHGYMYLETPAKQGTGGAKATPTASGYVAGYEGLPPISVTNYADGFGSLIPESTNNRAELTGVIKALEFIQTSAPLVNNVLLILDSRYALQGMEEWLEGWVANDFRKSDQTEVLNADLWRRLDALLKSFKALQITIQFQKIKGHSGDLGNDLADRNATRGVVAGTNGLSIESMQLKDGRGYWKTSIEKNRFFSHANWYFGTQGDVNNRSDDGRHIYYTGDIREDDDFLGKKISKATFSILYLKESEPVLDILRNSVASMGMAQYQGLSIGHLDQVFNPQIYNEILECGDALLVKDYARQRLTTTTDVLLSKELRPMRRAYHAVDALMALEGVLKSFLNPSATTRVRSTEITNQLYDSETIKKKSKVKLKSHITSAVRSLSMNVLHETGGVVAETEVPLTIGQDLPDRNTLAALADETVKAFVLTWPESPRAFRYATVITTDRDIGIWSGVYSNICLLPT